MDYLIAAANEAMRVQKSLEREVAALQQAMSSMQNQSQINNSAFSGYQEGALIVGKSMVEKDRQDLCIISLIMVHYVVKEVFRTQK
jgi:predicted esterase